jgi:hypothetical protein
MHFKDIRLVDAVDGIDSVGSGRGEYICRMVKYKGKECCQVAVLVLLMWATRRVGSCPTLIIKLLITSSAYLVI